MVLSWQRVLPKRVHQIRKALYNRNKSTHGRLSRCECLVALQRRQARLSLQVLSFEYQEELHQALVHSHSWPSVVLCWRRGMYSFVQTASPNAVPTSSCCLSSQLPTFTNLWFGYLPVFRALNPLEWFLLPPMISVKSLFKSQSMQWRFLHPLLLASESIFSLAQRQESVMSGLQLYMKLKRCALLHLRSAAEEFLLILI